MFELRRIGLSCRPLFLAGTVGCMAGCMPARPMNLLDVPTVADSYLVDATGPDNRTGSGSLSELANRRKRQGQCCLGQAARGSWRRGL